MSDMQLVIVGAKGRMGRALIKAVHETKDVSVAAAIDKEGSPFIGKDAGVVAGLEPIDVPLTDDVLSACIKADGIIDFTTPEATLRYAEIAAQTRIVHVIGTTGLSLSDHDAISAAARHAVVIQSGNMSLGINLLAVLVRQAAQTLDIEFDIELVEMHHRHKVDAPSGTALLLGEAAAQGRNIHLENHAIMSRQGITGERPPGDIGFATMRGGSVIGDHTVVFAGEAERLELTHRAGDRSLFAHGALKAALWGHQQKPGRYSMADVLGFS